MTKLVLFSIGLVGFLGIITSGLTTKEAEKTTNISPNSKGFAVVELFTSEGCSSCPPADDILRGLADRENVMALSFHVTYWNRLGWADPFSKPEFDERQYNYGSYFQLNSVYTPQLVINGEVEMVGSQGNKIEKELTKTNEKKTDLKVELSKTITDKKLTINYKINKILENKVLNLAIVERNITTKVLRGENGGRTLKHDNVVRFFKTVKMGKNTDGTSRDNREGGEEVILKDDFKLKDCSVIAYLQDTQTLKIVAASKIGIN
jgi:hypothetical protein